MADLNALIAQGYQFQPLPDPFAQYGKMQQLQNAGIQNQLTQQQLTAAQRAEAQTNVENQAYANAVNPDTGEIDYAKVRQALASGNAGSQIPKLEQARLAAKKAGLETQKLEGEINAQPVALAEAKSKAIGSQLETSRKFLDQIDPASPNARDQLIAWHQGNHTGYLGELLKSQGSTPEKTMADIDAAVAAGPKGISDFIGRSVEGTQAFQKKIAPMPKEVSNGKEKWLRDENSLSATYMQEIPGSRTTLQMSPYETDHLQFLKDKQQYEKDNPGFDLERVTLSDGTIKTVKVNKKTGLASDVTYGDKPLTGVSVPILDLNFRINKENYERLNPGVTVHKRTLPDGNEEIIAIDKQGVVRPITFGTPSSASQVSLSSLSPPVTNNLPVAVAAPANALPAAIASEAAPAVDPAVAEARATLAATRAALVSAPAAAAAPAPASVVQNAMYSGGNTNAMNSGLISAIPFGSRTKLAKLQTELANLPPNDPRAAEYESAIKLEAHGAPTNLAKLQTELANLPIGDPKRLDYINLINKETQQAPTQLAQLIKERDALGKNDPNRKAYDTAINAKQIEIGLQQSRLNLAQKRFNEEFAGTSFKPETIEMMAQMYLQTGNLPAVGQGRKGAEAKALILNKANEIQMAAPGATAASAASNVVSNKAELAGTTAGQRTLGTQIANVQIAANETNKMISVAKPYVTKVNPTDYPAVNAAGNFVARNTGDPNIVGLATSLNAIVNTYARAINPKGVATVSDKNHAREILNAAMSKGQLNEAFNVMEQEMNAALASGPETRAAMRPGAAAPAAAGAIDTNNKWLKGP